MATTIVANYNDWLTRFKDAGLKFIINVSPWVPRFNGAFLGPVQEFKKYAAIAHRLEKDGVYVIITGANENFNAYNVLNSQQKNSLTTRYPNETDRIKAAVSGGIAFRYAPVWNQLLDDIKALRDVYPDSTYLQVYNGNEIEAWPLFPNSPTEGWNVYDPRVNSFREFCNASLGFGSLKEEFAYREAYDDFEDEAKAIWGDRVIIDSTHVYGLDSDTTHFWAVGQSKGDITELGFKDAGTGKCVAYDSATKTWTLDPLTDDFWEFVVSSSSAKRVAFFELVSPQFYSFWEDDDKSDFQRYLWSVDGLNYLKDNNYDPSNKLPGTYDCLFAAGSDQIKQITSKYPIEFGGNCPLWAIPL